MNTTQDITTIELAPKLHHYKPVLWVGIAGPSQSGKSTVAAQISTIIQSRGIACTTIELSEVLKSILPDNLYESISNFSERRELLAMLAKLIHSEVYKGYIYTLLESKYKFFITPTQIGRVVLVSGIRRVCEVESIREKYKALVVGVARNEATINDPEFELCNADVDYVIINYSDLPNLHAETSKVANHIINAFANH